ncbi:MAG: zinc ABC transporter substrate-binding protein [Spirochaetaceae bacterium]|nr:zinc ABC transporter substrate-binding protein [Spirochaetaceae bacterium]
MKKLSLLVLTLLITLSVVSANGTKEISSKKLIAVSIMPQLTFAQAIVEDKMDVEALIGVGSSPENSELTSKQRSKFEKASIYFAIGVPTEELTILPFVNKNTKIIYLNNLVSKEYPELTIGSGRDPHIWLSPKRAIVMVNEMANEISKLDENNRDFYMTNAKAYIDKLTQLDRDIKTELSSLTNREFIVYHPAFGYFSSDYNLKMDVIEAEGKEATAKSLVALITKAKSKGIKNVFYQAEISGSQSTVFAKELGGIAIQLNPLSPDYINNLKTTAKLIKENI